MAKSRSLDYFLKFVLAAYVFCLCFWRMFATKEYYYGFGYLWILLASFVFLGVLVSLGFYVYALTTRLSVDFYAASVAGFAIFIFVHYFLISPDLSPSAYIIKYKTSFHNNPLADLIGAVIFVIVNVVSAKIVAVRLKFLVFQRVVYFAAIIHVCFAVAQWAYFLMGWQLPFGLRLAGEAGHDGLAFLRPSGLFTNAFPYSMFIFVSAVVVGIRVDARGEWFFEINPRALLLFFGSLLSNSKTAVVVVFVFLLYFFWRQNKNLLSLFIVLLFSFCLSLLLYYLSESGLDVRFLKAESYIDESRLDRFYEALPYIMNSLFLGYGFLVEFYTDNVWTLLLLKGGVIFALFYFLVLVSLVYMGLTVERRVHLKIFAILPIIVGISSTITSSLYGVPTIFVIASLLYYGIRSDCGVLCQPKISVTSDHGCCT